MIKLITKSNLIKICPYTWIKASLQAGTSTTESWSVILLPELESDGHLSHIKRVWAQLGSIYVTRDRSVLPPPVAALFPVHNNPPGPARSAKDSQKKTM